MIIEIKRLYKKEDYTIGKMYIDGVYFCDTLEDKDRGLTQSMSIDHIKKIKIPKKTAIPTGTYSITLNVISPKFSLKPFYKRVCGGKVPRILDVPGFTGILIHYGKDENWTEGCPLIGRNTVKGKLTDGEATFEAFYKKLKEAKENIYLEIS